MNAEEQLERARIYTEQLNKTDRRRGVMIAITLMGATVISLIFLIMAFIYKGQADAIQQEAIRIMTELDAAKLESARLRSDLDACLANKPR